MNGVVDQSQKRNTTSVADRAEFAGLPRLLVDIRHEAAHTELPGLALLQVASKQALAWLKLQYWEQQKEILVNVRLELKSKLVGHCLLLVDILNPSATATSSQMSDDQQELESKSEDLPEVGPQESLRAKKQQRKGLFKELLDLSLSSMSNLVSALVDDGLLEQDTLPMDEEVHSKQPVGTTGSTDGADLTIATNGADLTSVTDSAWKFTLRELSSHLPRLPEMLLVAIVKHINESCPQSETLRRPRTGESTRSQEPDVNVGELSERGSTDSLQRNRLISWCAWLLGARSLQAKEDLTEKEPRLSKLLKISNSLFVRPNLSRAILSYLLRLSLSTSTGQEPLVDLVSLISVRLGNQSFQHRVAVLAQLGTGMQRLHRNVINTSETQVASEASVGEETSQEGSFEKVTASSPPGGEGPNSTMKPALVIARKQQTAFFARVSSQKRVVQSPSERLLNEEHTVGSSLRLSKVAPSPESSSGFEDENSTLTPNVELRQEGSETQRWTVIEDWRPCAIGMIPSPCHSLGVLPSLDVFKHVNATDRAVPTTPEDVSVRDNSAATNSAGKPVDKNNSTAAVMLEPAVGKRATDEQVDGSRGKKIQKVHFEGDSPMDIDEGVVNASGVSSKAPMASKHSVGHQQEQTNAGSLLQGCLLQQGIFMPVTPQQFETLQAAVHVL